MPKHMDILKVLKVSEVEGFVHKNGKDVAVVSLRQHDLLSLYRAYRCDFSYIPIKSRYSLLLPGEFLLAYP